MSTHDVLAALLLTEQKRAEEYAAILARLAQLEGRRATYTVGQFAEACHCSEDTVRTAIAEDRIKSVSLGERTTVIPASELDGGWVSDRNKPRAQRNSAEGGR